MSLKRVTPNLIQLLERRTLMSSYFVSTAGSDQNPGTDALPWRSLQWAAHNVVAGDTVTVHAGNYIGFSLGWDFPQNGTPQSPITFHAEPGVTIDARNPKTADGIDFENSSYIIVEGFNLAPAATEDVWRAGIRAAGGGAGNIIRNNTLTMRNVDRYGIFSSFASDIQVENNNVSGTDNSGIYTSNSADHPIIRGNTVHNTGGNGIHFNGDISQGGNGLITNALIEKNVVYEVGALFGGSAINMDGVQNSRIQNNLLYNNYAKGISLYHIDAADGSKNNVVVNNTVVQAPLASGYALNIKTGSTDNIVFNNILIGGTGFGGAMNISYDSLSGLFSDYNIVSNRISVDDGVNDMTLSAWRTSRGYDTHSAVSSSDLLFVNSLANDYHLVAGSAAVNLGTNFALTQAPATDLSGALRPYGQNWDAGAYELIGPSDFNPPNLSNVAISDIKSGRVTISWDTDEPATAMIEYGTTPSYGSNSASSNVLLLHHSITVNGLLPDTQYHFRIASADVAANTGHSPDLIATTQPADVLPPVLSNISAAVVAPVYALITWSSDEPADSVVEYGTTNAYGSIASLSSLLQDHSIKISGLTPGTTYYFRVRSSDESLNTAVSQEFTFTTSTIGQLPTGLTAYWNFNEYNGGIALDASGNQQTGALQNGPQYVPGVSGTALNFDGINDYVRIGRSAAIETPSLTVTAWIKLAPDTQTPWATIVKKTFTDDFASPFTTFDLAMSTNDVGNSLTFFTGHTSATNSLTTPTAIPTGRWVFVAGTFDAATGRKCLYVDGTLVASTVVASPLAYDPSPSGDVYVGKYPLTGTAYSGFIDNVGMWNRALTTSDIATLAYAVPATSIVGSSGDDTIHLTVVSPNQIQVQVNSSAPYFLDPSILSEIQIDGLGGSDRLIFTATSGSDTVLFSALGIAYKTIATPITHRNMEMVLFDAGGGVDLLYVSSDSAVTLASNIELSALNIVPDGRLDVSDKKLLLHYGAGNPSLLGAAQYYIKTARNGGVWNYPGITSSLGNATDFTVAAFDDLATATLTIKLTRYGDGNGDGLVDIKDLAIMAAHWQQAVAAFSDGDFNYDGIVNAADLGLLAINWQLGMAVTAAAPATTATPDPIVTTLPIPQPDPPPSEPANPIEPSTSSPQNIDNTITLSPEVAPDVQDDSDAQIEVSVAPMPVIQGAPTTGVSNPATTTAPKGNCGGSTTAKDRALSERTKVPPPPKCKVSPPSQSENTRITPQQEKKKQTPPKPTPPASEKGGSCRK